MHRALEELGIRDVDVDLHSGVARGNSGGQTFTREQIEGAIGRRVLFGRLRSFLERLAAAPRRRFFS